MPIHTAASSGSTLCASVLVQHGAKWDTKDHNGNTPKMLAEYFGHTDTVQYFSSLENSKTKAEKEEM